MVNERTYLLNKVGDGLTDIANKSDGNGFYGGWVRIKMDMLILYNALSRYNGLSQTSSQIAQGLFNGIMRSKFNGNNTIKPNEDKRIYNDKCMDEKNILMELYPSKYNVDKSKIDNDISNLRKKLWELHDFNIFYRLVYNDTNVFFMERLFICWKSYNSSGCVVPRTIKKIVVLHDDIVNRIIAFETIKGHCAQKQKVENAYMKFLMGMIGKMNLEVGKNIKRWVVGEDISIYLSNLLSQIENIDDMEGLSYSDDFMLRLPSTISEKMEDRMINMSMKTCEDLEKDLLPKNQNSVSVDKKLRSPKTKKKKLSVSNIEDLGPELRNFKGNHMVIEPFKNPSQFYKFYISSIKLFVKANEMGVYPKFASYDSECNMATQIMDILKENSRESRGFLASWIEYYCRTNLKGKKSQNIDNTSLNKFKKTFNDFSQSYYIPR